MNTILNSNASIYLSWLSITWSYLTHPISTLHLVNLFIRPSVQYVNNLPFLFPKLFHPTSTPHSLLLLTILYGPVSLTFSIKTIPECSILCFLTIYSNPPLSTREMFQDSQWMPEMCIVPNAIYSMLFLYMHPMIKFNL